MPDNTHPEVVECNQKINSTPKLNYYQQFTSSYLSSISGMSMLNMQHLSQNIYFNKNINEFNGLNSMFHQFTQFQLMKENEDEKMYYAYRKQQSVSDPKYKTELCKTYISEGFCKYKNKCRFAHGVKDLIKYDKVNDDDDENQEKGTESTQKLSFDSSNSMETLETTHEIHDIHDIHDNSFSTKHSVANTKSNTSTLNNIIDSPIKTTITHSNKNRINNDTSGVITSLNINATPYMKNISKNNDNNKNTFYHNCNSFLRESQSHEFSQKCILNSIDTIDNNQENSEKNYYQHNQIMEIVNKELCDFNLSFKRLPVFEKITQEEDFNIMISFS